MQQKKFIGPIMLIVTAIIWGSAFVAQKVGMDHLGPFTFAGIRFSLSSLFILIIVLSKDLIIHHKLTLFTMPKNKLKAILLGGILCGIALAIASNIQQFAMQKTSVSKTSFITALYIVLVPVLGIFLKKHLKKGEILSVIIALISLALLCFNKEEKLVINGYDMALLVCALFFSIQILLVDHYAKDNDCLLLALIQFSTCAIISWILILLFETPSLETVKESIFPLLYAGIASGGIAFTLQLVGQKYTKPVVASLIMSLEAVVGLISGVIFLHERLSLREGIGSILMLFAIILAQIPFDKLKKVKNYKKT